jgi:predicted dehydrogenase
MMSLRAVVIGAGWAGEGHTTALRAAGVEVVAMCGRTPEPAHAMAEKLGVEEVRFDWRAALEEFRPDIVSIATPARPHREMAEAASELGCHVACDKPLATNAAEARAMLLAALRARVKHAYATTSRYDPVFAYTRTLLASSLIGQVREIEYLDHADFSPLLPYSWVHELSLGGGGLNNAFTHQLGQVLHMTGGRVLSAAGEARRLIDRAPVGASIHDFRDLWSTAIDREQAEEGEWGEVDADFGYTVMVQLEMPDGYTASVLFHTSLMAPKQHPNYLAFYGTEGTLQLSAIDAFWPNRIHHYSRGREAWEEMPVPQELIDALPHIEDHAQRDWNQLFREFVADIRGDGYAGYPTFHDGWVAAEVIEIVRKGQGWTALPERPDVGQS